VRTVPMPHRLLKLAEPWGNQERKRKPSIS
jgi:hypothetical protein